MVHSRNKNYDTSYIAFDRLLGCLHEAEFDEEILGTANPMDYIEIDWNEVFEEYYISIKNQISGKAQVASKAVEVWMSFPEICTDIILKNFNDIEYIEQSIRKYIAENLECWFIQHQLYELLKSFYQKLGLEFNEITITKSLVCYNPNFLNDLGQGYINSEMWEEAVQTIKDALKEVSDRRIVSALNKKMVGCFENLNMFSEAYDVAVKMFIDHNSHELYLRARSLAMKISGSNTFVDSMVKYIQSDNRYDSISTLLIIFSFEGYTLKLSYNSAIDRIATLGRWWHFSI